MAQVARVNDTAAPAEACQGLEGEGTVKWLYLRDTKGLSKGGIDTVYRLETAGGAAPATCEGMPERFEVRYAAQCEYQPPALTWMLVLTMVFRLDLWSSRLNWTLHVCP
jgi:hypothetical protein